MESINDRVRIIREELKIKQTEFAKKLGIPQSYLSAIEAGKKEVTAKLIGSLIEHFQVSADWIYTGKSEKFITFGYDQNFNKLPTSGEKPHVEEEKLDLTKNTESEENFLKHVGSNVESISVFQDELREDLRKISKEEFDKLMGKVVTTLKEGRKEHYLKNLPIFISHSKSDSYVVRHWIKKLTKDLEKEKPQLERLLDNLHFVTDNQTIIEDFYNNFDEPDIKSLISEGFTYEEAKKRYFEALERYQTLAVITDEFIPVFKKLLKEIRTLMPDVGSPFLRNEMLE